MHVGLHVKCPLLLSNFNHNWNVLTILVKLYNITFDENPFSGSKVVSYVQMEEWSELNRCATASEMHPNKGTRKKP
jgi:hypothetical protein